VNRAARAAWAKKLQLAAPWAQLGMLSVLAALLADKANCDVLLIVADALAEAAEGAQVEGRTTLCATLQQLAGVLRDEAPRRAAGSWHAASQP